MKKRLTALLLCATLALSAPSGCISAKTQSSSAPETAFAEGPALWTATKDGGGTVYLFGSIHAAAETAYPLPDYVMKAYEKSGALAVEVDVEKIPDSVYFDFYKRLLYSDGTVVSDHVPAESYAKAVKLLTDAGIYDGNYDHYKPALWNSVFDQLAVRNAGLDTDLGIDRHFLDAAHESGKPIYELETAEAQLELTFLLPDAAQELLFEYGAEFPGEAADDVKRLYEYYMVGDTDGLLALTEEEEELPREYQSRYEDLKEYFDAYDKALGPDRNAVIADKAQSYIDGGETVFFVVGTAHLLGEKGITRLLRDRGYTVSRAAR